MKTLLLAGALGLAPWAVQDGRHAGVASAEGLMGCASAPACGPGASILSRGGKAVDAALATSFALAGPHPSAGNVGGGGFMVIRTPGGKVTSFDYRETAPRRGTATM